MVNKTNFEPINIDDFIHDPINQEKVQSYPPELVGRFNSFIVTAFDDSMTVEMQIRTMIKWVKENIDVTMSALDNMEAFKQDSMAFQNHVKDTLVNLINQFTDTFDDNLQFEMQEILKQWDDEGYLQSLINEYTNERIDTLNLEVINARGGKTTLGERFNEIDDNQRQTDEQLAQKLNKDESGSVTWAMASQDFREQITGGNTAVVGVDAIIKENITNGAVTPEKTTFINNTLTFELERGTLHSGRNENVDLTTRVRSVSIVKHTDGVYIVRKDPNYLIGVSTYENGVYDGIDRGWIDKDVIELPEKNELRINVRRRDNAAIADDELATIAEGIEIKHNFQSANAKDVERVVEDITAVKGSITQTILLKSEEFEIGTINGNTPTFDDARGRMKNMLRVYKGDIINFKKDPTLVNYGISVSDLNGVWRGVDYGWLNQSEFIIEEDSLIKLNVRYVNDRTLDENTLKTLTENTFTIGRSIRNYVDNKFNNIDVEAIKKHTSIGSILVEYGRINGASYVFARIPKTLNDGSRLVPKVALTSRDGSLSGAKRSALNYAREQDPIFTVNAGLFNMSRAEPVGQLIIDGVSLINTPMTSDNGVPIHPDECYPLAIDANGNLTTYPRNADTADMIADGVKYAVTGWGKLVDNFQIATEDINNEIVHNGKKYIRQSIGQYQNGDYCVCSVDMTRGTVTNEAGLYYEELAQIFVDKGVKFAYSLDGGGSTQTVLGKRQLNPIYEGSAGRAVPTVIEFYIA